MPLNKCVIASYETKLGIYHPWVLRKLLSVAFNATTSRENFVRSYLKEKQEVTNRDTPFPDEEAYEDFTKFYQNCESLSSHIWSFFKTQGIEEIP